MYEISIDAVRDWFVVNESFLSAVAALIALASVIFLGLRNVFKMFASKSERDSTPAAQEAEKLVDEAPSIAVLPFRTITSGESEQYLGDSIPEDISVNLSYARLIPVISASTSFRFRGSSKSVAEIGSELGARYLITGTIGKSADKLRVVVEVADCKTERQIWSDRFIWDAGDIFNLQEEISDGLYARLASVINDAEMTRARRQPPQSAAAFDHVMKGMWHDNQLSREENLNAIQEFEKAIEIDPDYANAHSLLASALHDRAYIGWSEDAVADFLRAAEEAKTAVTLDSSIAEAHLILCYSALLSRQFDSSERHAKRALELNPFNGRCWLGAGLVALYRGRHQEATESFARVERLNPNDPASWVFSLASCLAAMMNGDFELALEQTVRARAHRGGQLGGEMLACAALVALGRKDEAREIAAANPERVKRTWPLSLSRMPFEDPKNARFVTELVHEVAPGIFPEDGAKPAVSEKPDRTAVNTP